MCVCVWRVGERVELERRRVIDFILYARWRGNKGFLDRGDSLCKSTEA